MRTELKAGVERRTEPRYPKSGEVRLWQGTPQTVFLGRLLDTASTGFRARHGRLSLASGELVSFFIQGRTGVARAVWTRILDGEAETGFRVLSGDLNGSVSPG
jgi:hypothetical protein